MTHQLDMLILTTITFTTSSYPVCVLILINLIGPCHKSVVHLDDVETVVTDTFLHLAGVLAEHHVQLRPR